MWMNPCTWNFCTIDPIQPPLNSGLATVGAGESPNVERTPLYSGTSVTRESLNSACKVMLFNCWGRFFSWGSQYPHILCFQYRKFVKGTPPLNSGLLL